jgi:hypothetical protein
LANAQILATGDFNLLTNASRSLANTSGLINAELFNEESNSEVVFIFDKDNTDLDGGANLPVTNIYPIHLVTGLDVTSDEDFNHCWVLPGAYISNGNDEGYFNTSNFIIDYGQGEIQILPAPLTVIAHDSSKVYGSGDPVEFTYTISEDTPLVLDDVVENVFTGSLERAAGEDVVDEGYAISRGTLNAGQNYELTVVPGIFTISPTALTVNVVPGQSKVYGEDDPVLIYTSIGLIGDDVFTGALTREEGEDVGSYMIRQGTLDAGVNYTILSEETTFTIAARDLNISADNSSKIFGETDPPFTYTVTSGSLASWDQIIGSLEREPGETINQPFDILQGSLGVQNNDGVNTTSNYNFNFQPGVFTIGYPLSDVKKIRPYLNCVEFDGTYYYANFGYENSNAFDIYIEAFGPDNYFEGAGVINGTAMPSVFKAGGGDFSIKFDGTKVVWAVTSLGSEHKSAATSEASAGSGRCGYTGARLAGVADDHLGSELDLVELSTYPNPVSSVFYINLDRSLVSTANIQLVDIQGKVYDTRLARDVSGSRIEIDMAGMSRGMYLVKLGIENDMRMIKIVKQ